MPGKACKNCHFITSGYICPNCKSTNLSDDWTGIAIIVDADKSLIAQKMSVIKPGRYAIRVR